MHFTLNRGLRAEHSAEEGVLDQHPDVWPVHSLRRGRSGMVSFPLM